MIDFFSSTYGWSVTEVRNLTFDEVTYLSNSSAERFERMYGTKDQPKDGKKGKMLKRKAQRSMSEMMDEFTNLGVVREEG